MSMERTPAQSAIPSETAAPPRINVPESPEPSEDPQKAELEKHPSITNPLAIVNGQSWFFWASKGDRNQSQRPALDTRASQVSQLSQISRLTSEMGDGRSENGEEAVRAQRKCTRCGGEEFEAANRGVGQFVGRNKVGEKAVICKKCRAVLD
jgi:hypothetical protein